MSYRELLLGCGRARDKRLVCPSRNSYQWAALTTLDYNPAHNPDIAWNLNKYPWPLDSDAYDEIHAYEVLEHLGKQGDVLEFFSCFSQIWRALKPGGYLAATCPSRFSPWLWGDPSHTRAIVAESLIFLDQEQYHRQVDGPHPTSMSDFRALWYGDFKLVRADDDKTNLRFMLQAIKPIRTFGAANDERL